MAEPSQYSILGLPVVHLSPSLKNPQLPQRGILPMAETSQIFASRISLFRSNWEKNCNRGISYSLHICSPSAVPSRQPTHVLRELHNPRRGQICRNKTASRTIRQWSSLLLRHWRTSSGGYSPLGMEEA